MKLLGFISAAALLAWGLAAPAAAADSIARVVIVRGEVTVARSDGSSGSLERRAELFVGDRIITGPEGWVQLRFVDSALLSLSCDSVLDIRDYQHLDRSDDRARLHLESGRVRTITGTVQRSNYLFSAGQVEIRPVGTDFEVMVDDAESHYFAVYDGAIRISSTAGNVELGSNQPTHYAVLHSETGMTTTLLRPAQLGNGVLGGVQCP